MRKRLSAHNIFRFSLLFLFLIVALFPIYWMLITSFKNQNEIYRNVATFWPENFTLSAYKTLLTETPFLNALKNSIILSLSVSIFTILVSLPASYAIGRLVFRGRKVMSRAVLFTYLIPSALLYIPLFIFLSELHLSNSLPGLMLIYPTFTIPYATWILIPYLKSIPRELEEAAEVDGCTRFQSMLRIVFPLAMPGIVTTFIFSFTMCWGEFLYAFVNISDTAAKTYPLIIQGLIWGDLYPWGQIMAGGIIACAPVLLIYLFASNLLVGGLTQGGIKQ